MLKPIGYSTKTIGTDIFPSNIPIYVINLDRSTERLTTFQAMIGRVNNVLESKHQVVLRPVRIAAVDGRTPGTIEQLVVAYNPDATHGQFNETMNRGEYGCACSHLQAIEAAYQTGHEHVLIAEDDVSLEPLAQYYHVFLNTLAWVPHDYHVIQLQSGHDSVYQACHPLVQWGKFSHGCGLYMLSRKGMKAIMNRYVQHNQYVIPSPIDHMVYEYDVRNAYVTTIPFAMIQVESSTLRTDISAHLYYQRRMQTRLDELCKTQSLIDQFQSENQFETHFKPQGKYLIFTSAGNMGFDAIKQWVDPMDSEVDLVIFYYRDDPEQYKQYKSLTPWVARSQGVKFDNYYRFHQCHRDVLRQHQYQYVAVFDDDITLVSGDENPGDCAACFKRLFQACETYEPWIAGPACSREDPKRFIQGDWIQGLHMPGSSHHYTNFIETNTPVFRFDCLDALMQCYPHGEIPAWGSNIWYIEMLGSRARDKYVIVDTLQYRNPTPMEKNVTIREIDTVNPHHVRRQQFMAYKAKHGLTYEPGMKYGCHYHDDGPDVIVARDGSRSFHFFDDHDSTEPDWFTCRCSTVAEMMQCQRLRLPFVSRDGTAYFKRPTSLDQFTRGLKADKRSIAFIPVDDAQGKTEQVESTKESEPFDLARYRGIVTFLRRCDVTCLVVHGMAKTNHTHRFIHQAVYDTFRFIQRHFCDRKLQVLWTDNASHPAYRDESARLLVFSSPHYNVGTNLPVRRNIWYVLHYDKINYITKHRITRYDELLRRCQATKYVEFRKTADHPVEQIGDTVFWYDPADNSHHLPWATNLLPPEITRNIEWIQRQTKPWHKSRDSYFCGSIWYLNKETMAKWNAVCQEQTIEARFVREPDEDKHQRDVRHAFIAPAIQGAGHITSGNEFYMPCRIFKNISYGAVPVTNNLGVHRMFRDHLMLYDPDVKQLLDRCIAYMDQLSDPEAFTRHKAELVRVMTFVRDEHTYLNRFDQMLQKLKPQDMTPKQSRDMTVTKRSVPKQYPPQLASIHVAHHYYGLKQYEQAFKHYNAASKDQWIVQHGSAQDLYRFGDAARQISRPQACCNVWQCLRNTYPNDPNTKNAVIQTVNMLLPNKQFTDALELAQSYQQHPKIKTVVGQLNVCCCHDEFQQITPVTLDSEQQIQEIRRAWLAKMERPLPEQRAYIDIHQYLSITPQFYLSYHGVPNRDMFSRLCSYYRKLMPYLTYTAEHVTKPRSPGKLRIGFITAFFSNHSVTRDRLGVIEHLPRDRFDVMTFWLNDPNDHLGKRAWNAAQAIKFPDPTLDSMRRTIESKKLDVLVFCELGMNQSCYWLSYSRLARQQISTWGHSDTSGVDTVDWFISSKLYEIADADQHYSEKLYRCNSLCTYYYDVRKLLDITIPKHDLTHYRIPTNQRMIFYPQSLFKFHPWMDQLFRTILDRYSDVMIVCCVDSTNHQKTMDRMLRRLDSSLGPTRPRFRCLDKQSVGGYMRLMQLSRFVLDAYPFGACNSAIEAFSLGKVVLTYPGPMINGRFCRGFYQRMDIMEPVATSRESFLQLIDRGLTDTAWLRGVEKKIKERHGCLFEEQASVDEWATMLETITKEP